MAGTIHVPGGRVSISAGLSYNEHAIYYYHHIRQRTKIEPPRLQSYDAATQIQPW